MKKPIAALSLALLIVAAAIAWLDASGGSVAADAVCAAKPVTPAPAGEGRLVVASDKG